MNRQLSAGLAAGLAAGVIAGGVATAQAVTSTRTVDVCVKRGSVVSALRNGTCPDRTRERTINVRGVRGPAGSQGEQGIQGEQGPQGERGPAGSDATVPSVVTSSVSQLQAGMPNLTSSSLPSWSNTGRAPTYCTLGEVRLVGANFSYGLPADGRLLPISQNTALFSLYGTMYGGDGRTTFALPDLRRVAPKGLIYSVCHEGVFPSRS